MNGRATVKLGAILLWTGAWFVLWGIGAVLLLPFPGSRLRWRHLAVSSWAKGIATIIGMHRVIEGHPPMPPFILATNHLSYLDILLLHSVVQGVFVAKHDMRSWPVLGALAQLIGTIWVDRTRRRDAIRALHDIDEAIGRGDGVILFPEGTTSSGTALLPMKPALLDWAARERFPVHYAAITYRMGAATPSAREALCWWGDARFGRHAWGVLRLRRFESMISFGPEPVSARSRGELVERVRRGIEELFEPVDGHW